MSSNWWIEDDTKKELNNLKFYSVALLEEFSVILWNFHLESNFERETSGGQILRPPGGRPRVLPDPEILPFEQQKSLASARERLMCSNRAKSDLSQTEQHTIRLTCCQTGTRRRVPLKSSCNQHWHFATPHKITLSSQIWGKGWVEIVGGREGGDSLGGEVDLPLWQIQTPENHRPALQFQQKATFWGEI